MASASPPPSASGARLTGDDVQHAIAWYHALRALHPQAYITSVAVEAINAGNVDDVVVRHVARPDDYLQVKTSVAAKEPATIDWLTTATDRGSIFQRFHDFYIAATATGINPQMQLITNRSLKPDDPILTLRDRHDRVADRLRRATTKHIVAARAVLADHLGVTEEEACIFLDHLRFRTDASEATWIESIKHMSIALGLEDSDAAIRLGISEVREWVKTSRAEKTPTEIGASIDRLNLRVAEPWETLVVSALDTEANTDDATMVVDWVDRFVGDDARTRRGLRDPTGWNTALRDDIVAAERALHTKRVLVRGHARLPVWLAIGIQLCRTRGYHVGIVQNGVLWSTEGTPSLLPALTTSPLRNPVPGEPLALSIAISADPSDDAALHLATHIPTAGHLRVALATGTGSYALNGPDHAWATALSLRDEVRRIASAMRPSTVHLFLAAPRGLALLLGHVWDRIPDTQTYEDLSTRGYEPAFFIRN